MERSKAVENAEKDFIKEGFEILWGEGGRRHSYSPH